MADSLEELLSKQAQGATGADPLEALLASQANPQPPADYGNEGRRTSLGVQPVSTAAQLKHQGSLFGRAAVTSLTALPNMVGDATNGLINLGVMGYNAATGSNVGRMQYPSQVTQNAMTDAGVDLPENRQERIVQAGTSAMGSVGPTAALGKVLAKSATPVAKAIGDALRTALGTQAVSSAASGASGQGAAELGFGPVGQFVASVLGGGTAALGMQGAKSVVNAATAPSKAELYAQALRDQAENAKPMPDSKPRYKFIDGKAVPIEQVGAPVTTPTIAPNKPIPPVSEAPVGGIKPVQEQLGNVQTLKKIGLDTQRPATISGDRFASGIDYENAKLDNPLGQATREQLAKEQSTIKNFGTKIIQDTGAQAVTPEQVGQTIRQPMQALSQHFDDAIGQVYNAAKAKAGEMGQVDPKNLDALLKNNNFRESLLASPEGTTLLGSIERQVKRFQGIPIEGEELPQAPRTVNSAENLRKWLNAQWSPKNSRLIGQVKEAIDTDVAAAGGQGVFDQARKLHGIRKDTLDNPNGISKLLNNEGPNGINQAIPDEQVATKLLGMPTNQFEHIVNTLKRLPPNLQEMGSSALSEIKAALAKSVYAAGDSGGTQQGPSLWNASNVNRALNANRSKMTLVFSPEELENFRTLHDAGYILQTPTQYKGAAAQGYNYLQSGAIKLPAVAGSALGAYLGGPVGAGVGGGMGLGASSVIKKGVDSSMAARLAEQLRNPMPTFPNQGK